MSLVNKIMYSSKGLALAGVLYASGCTPEGEAAMGRFILTGMVNQELANGNADALGAKVAADAWNANENAKAGRTQINQQFYNGQQRPYDPTAGWADPPK